LTIARRAQAWLLKSSSTGGTDRMHRHRDRGVGNAKSSAEGRSGRPCGIHLRTPSFRGDIHHKGGTRQRASAADICVFAAIGWGCCQALTSADPQIQLRPGPPHHLGPFDARGGGPIRCTTGPRTQQTRSAISQWRAMDRRGKRGFIAALSMRGRGSPDVRVMLSAIVPVLPRKGFSKLSLKGIPVG
jgi:hypothetical protein